MGFLDFLETKTSSLPKSSTLQSVKAAKIETILGPMLALADSESLLLLEFLQKKRLAQDLEKLKKVFSISIGTGTVIESIKSELDFYFAGQIIAFKTPFRILGSSFQQQVWSALRQIPYGQTRSYAEQAELIGKPKGYRAVANANGANRLSIIIPCHRVIASDGSLGGYSGGLDKKIWLLEHERKGFKF